MKYPVYLLFAFQLCIYFPAFSLTGNANSDSESRTPYENGAIFYTASIEEAKALAGTTGKLAFVEFYASWCGPCQWMDQTTFSDSQVSQLLNENYIAIKVNIEEFDGFEAKEHYQVKALPTMLIFNSTGTLVERIEETLAPSKLIKILMTHDHKANRIVIRHPANSSPSNLKAVAKHQPIGKTINKIASPANYIKRPHVKPDMHRVWVGTFRDQVSANNYYQALTQTFLDPIFVVKDVVSSQVIYKVFMGEFHTRGEAEDYKRILKTQFNINGKLE